MLAVICGRVHVFNGIKFAAFFADLAEEFFRCRLPDQRCFNAELPESAVNVALS